MKRGTIIIIAFATYIVAMVAMFIGVDQYVKAKDVRLKTELRKSIGSIFSNKDMIVDVVTSGNPVKYSPMPIPKNIWAKSTNSNDSILAFFEEKGNEEWITNYGDLYKMYHIHWKQSEETLMNPNPEGWRLCVLEWRFGSMDYELSLTNVFPYAIGYKRQEWPEFYNYAPDVQTAVDNAYEFYTNNDKSSYYKYFQKGSANDMWNKIYDSYNEYYYLEEDKTPHRFYDIGAIAIDETVERKNGRPVCPVKNGYMHNGYYRVFVALTQPQTYSIKKRPWKPDENDRKNLWLYWGIGLTVLLILIVVPLWIVDYKHSKLKSESLYDKLKRLCNPANFINENNYEKDKVDKANAIYQRLMEITPYDKDILTELQLQAVRDLDINLIDSERLKELKEKINPKNFLNPYNAEKVALANELYSMLNSENLTYVDMVSVEDRAKTLL